MMEKKKDSNKNQRECLLVQRREMCSCNKYAREENMLIKLLKIWKVSNSVLSLCPSWFIFLNIVSFLCLEHEFKCGAVPKTNVSVFM
jgi:hypothetical protein